jgi:neurofibromin 1
VPQDATRFIIRISKELAKTEPQLTSDFLTEFFVSWESIPEDQRPQSIAYMSPWLAGLRTSVLVGEGDSERGRERVATLLRKLIDVAIVDHSLAYTFEHTVWPIIAQDEVLLDIFLDELVKTAMGYNMHEEAIDNVSSIVIGIGSVTIRGKVLSRLRKALSRSSLRPTKYLPDNAVWAEICTLLQFCVALSFDSGVQSQMFLPEMFHIVTMLSNTGSQPVRMLVYKLLINSVHAVCTSFKLDDAKSSKLKASLDSFSEPRTDIFPTHPTFHRDGASVSTLQDSGATLAATEHLAAILFDVCTTAAPSTDMSNAWRSRWMSLVASTAFQNNPAIQPRAFAVMGYLAREEVDDDLLYQVLVALRNSISRFDEESNSEMVVSIMTSLSKMMAKLPSASRYGLQIFWLAISLVRLVPSTLFNCAAQFLEAVLTNIGTVGDVRGKNMVSLLMQGRTQLDQAAMGLDAAYGIYFSEESFHFAVCACLARGLTDTVTRPIAMRVLSSFYEMTTWTPESELNGTAENNTPPSPYLALIQARAVGQEELKDSLWLAGINPEDLGHASDPHYSRDVAHFADDDLLLITVMEMVDFQFLEDTVQTRTLHWLNKLAKARPAVMVHL